MSLPQHMIADAVKAALAEDLGLAGDITTDAIVSCNDTLEMRLVLREPGVIAGLPLAMAAFRYLDPSIAFDVKLTDGGNAVANSVIATISGNARAILTAERVALNFIQHLSGIATATNRYVQEVAGTKAHIVCTRKTTPGLRALQKYAVRVGGGHNHRFGLFDAILIKDNHIAQAGSVSVAIEKARQAAGHLVKIEVEVDTLDQLHEAMKHDVDAILLDNMPVDSLREAVKHIRSTSAHIVCEASGGVNLNTVRAIAETGVDMISVGALTHAVISLDIGLDYQKA